MYIARGMSLIHVETDQRQGLTYRILQLNARYQRVRVTHSTRGQQSMPRWTRSDAVGDVAEREDLCGQYKLTDRPEVMGGLVEG